MRLAKLCGMLGSNHDGERASAGLLADRLVREAGLTWADVIGAPSEPQPPPKPEPPPPQPDEDDWLEDWREVAAACLAQEHRLNTWERTFLAGLKRFPYLSEKQRRVLHSIALRVLDGV